VPEETEETEELHSVTSAPSVALEERVEQKIY